MKGQRIGNLNQLMRAAAQKLAVICPKGGQWAAESSRPAAWVANFPGAVLHRLFLHGMWVYVPKQKKTRKEGA